MKHALIILAALSLSACASTKKTSSEPTAASSVSGSNYSGHGAESVPPEVVQKFAPTPVDPKLARYVQSMLDIRAPGMGMPTPDGSKLFFGWSVTGTPQVWRLDGPKAFPVQMTGGTDRTTVVGVTPNGRWVIVMRDRAGEENPGIYLQDPAGGALKEVIHKPKVQTSLNQISEDGNILYYTANDQKTEDMAIYAYNISNGTRTTVWDKPGLWALGDIRKDGLFLLEKATGSLSSEWFTLDPKTKELKPVIGQGEAQEYQVSFGAKPGEFLVLTNRLGNFRRLYVSGKDGLKPLTPERKMDVESFSIDDNRYRILVSWNDQGYSRLEAYDAKTFSPIALPKFPSAASVYPGVTSMNSRFTTIGVESGKAPRTSYVYDWETKKLTQWVIPSAPEVKITNFAEEKLEFYTARDGTKIPMLVRRPEKCGAPCPVVVNFHGGPESQSRPGFSTWAQMFVDAGFIYVEPNVRGSDGYGKEWLHADDGRKRLQVVTDIEDASIFIRKNWKANGKEPKVGVMGGSYGGYSTLYAMTKFAGAYDSGVANVGMSNLVTFLQNTAPYRRILRITEYGDPEKDREALVELSPTTHLSKVKGPLLIIQGVSDPRVPAGEAVQMYEAMKSSNEKQRLEFAADTFR
jgi:dipeptidyl aminopeptidase/acylaminoacyl peptidase